MQGPVGLWAAAPPGVVALVACLGVQLLVEGKRSLGWILVGASLALGTAVVAHQSLLQPTDGASDARGVRADVLVASKHLSLPAAGHQPPGSRQ
jgi:hypothetical protein